MPDTRNPHDTTRETVSQNAREAVSQTEDTGRRIIEAGAETTRCTAQADTESARRAVDVSTEPTRRAMETGADSVPRLTDASFNTAEAEDAVRRASVAVQAVHQTGSVVAQVAQDTLTTWADYGMCVAERRVNTLQRLITVRSPVAALDLHGEHLRAEMELFVNCASRSAERTASLFREAGNQVKQMCEEAVQAATAGRKGWSQGAPRRGND
jgi:hypothetical protein